MNTELILTPTALYRHGHYDAALLVVAPGLLEPAATVGPMAVILVTTLALNQRCGDADDRD